MSAPTCVSPAASAAGDLYCPATVATVQETESFRQPAVGDALRIADALIVFLAVGIFLWVWISGRQRDSRRS